MCHFPDAEASLLLATIVANSFLGDSGVGDPVTEPRDAGESFDSSIAAYASPFADNSTKLSESDFFLDCWRRASSKITQIDKHTRIAATTTMATISRPKPAAITDSESSLVAPGSSWQPPRASLQTPGHGFPGDQTPPPPSHSSCPLQNWVSSQSVRFG
jgi:hypothetical protein